jgi:ABC-type branched-subunit amino acid transport system substrate-binding protein
MKKTLANGMALATLSLAFTAGFAAAEDSGKPILIGQIAATTGAYGSTGTQTVYGAQVAVDEINAKGGLLGRKLKLEWYNDNASGTLSGQLFKKLVSEGAVAIVGSPATGPVTAQLADRYKIPDIGLVDGGGLTVYPDGPDGKPHKWVFEFGGNTFAWGAKFGEYALKHCPNGIAVLHDRTSYGQGGFYGIKQVYDKAGKKIASDQPVTENWSTGATAGLMPEIAKIKESGASCVDVWLSPQDQAAFVQDLHTVGAKYTVFGNDETNADNVFVGLAGAQADGIIGAFLTSDMNPSPELKQFIDVYTKRFNEPPTQYSETTYDSIMMLAKIINETKSTDRKTIRDAFEKVTGYKGLTGELSFSPRQHQTITAEHLTLVKYDAAGKKWVPLED